MLRRRLTGAALIILPTLLLLWLDDQYNFGLPGIWIVPLGLFLGWVGARELAALISDDPLTRNAAARATALAIAILALPAFKLWDVAGCELSFWGWTPLAISASTGLVTLIEMRRFGRGDHVVARLTATICITSFLAIPLAFALGLRQISPDRTGLLLLASVIFVAKWADAGAYFSGRLLGRTPLAPVLSPKKTWEGLAGGALFAFVAALVFHWAIMPWLLAVPPTPRSGVWLLMYAVSLTGAGLLGDLSISLLKRDAERKDSGQLLPGLGGCLDVIDSLLWTCPLGYIWWSSVM